MDDLTSASDVKSSVCIAGGMVSQQHPNSLEVSGADASRLASFRPR